VVAEAAEAWPIPWGIPRGSPGAASSSGAPGATLGARKGGPCTGAPMPCTWLSWTGQRTWTGEHFGEALEMLKGVGQGQGEGEGAGEGEGEGGGRRGRLWWWFQRGSRRGSCSG